MKILGRTLLAVILLISGMVIYNYPKLTIISGYSAKNMASGMFVANRTAASIAEYDNNMPLIKLAEAKPDIKKKQVSASVFGFMDREAVFREGLGCVLINEVYDFKEVHSKPNRSIKKDSLPFPYGNLDLKDSVFPEVNYELITKAVDEAFARPETQKTRSVLIVYKDHILAERYISGFNENTPILGWSMTKSVLATLFGILQYQGEISVDSPAPVASWEVDERKQITINHLLRMQSGLEWEEDYGSISDVTRMLFLAKDMTVIQRDKELVAKPTAIWNYSSGTSNLLSGILRQHFSNYQQYLDFPYTALIDRIGMHSMLLEADMAGNYVGSSYSWANTRDWAKLGLLYLHQGNWNGEQLFNKSWVQYVTRPTQHSDGTYGAHFWLNTEGKYPKVPRDLFSANGYQGQYVFIIPSKNLVIVRTGLAEPPDFDINTFLESVSTAIKS